MIIAGPSGKASIEKGGPIKTDESGVGSSGSVNGDGGPCDQPPLEPKVVVPATPPMVVDVHVPIQQPAQQVYIICNNFFKYIFLLVKLLWSNV